MNNRMRTRYLHGLNKVNKRVRVEISRKVTNLRQTPEESRNAVIITQMKILVLLNRCYNFHLLKNQKKNQKKNSNLHESESI